MILERISLENWLAFAGFFDLELPTGAVAVVGRYADDPQRSNWSGKTAFLEAIEWCLFGTHRKRYDDDVIFGDADFVRVRLEIAGYVHTSKGAAAGTFTVERTRKRGKATRLVLDIPKRERLEKKAAQARIEEILGFDSEDYRATQCFAQGDTEAIVAQTSGKRREIVGAWLELDAWLRVAARARTKVRALAELHREARAAAAMHQKALETSEGATILGERVDTARTEEEAAEVRVRELDAELEKVAGAEIARLDRIKLAKVSEEGRALRRELTGAVVPGLEEARVRTAKARAAEERARDELSAAVELSQGRFDGVCPVTVEGCPVADEVRENRSAALTKAERARAAHKVARDNHDTCRDEIRDLERQEREIDRKRERYRLLVEEARTLKASADRYSDTEELSEDGVERLKFDRGRYRDAASEARSRRNVATRDLAELEATVGAVNVLEEELDRAASELRIANLAARSVGPSGIPARIAEAQLGILEERAGALLVGSGLSFVFAWDRITRDLVKRCLECGYAFKGVKDKECPACDAARGMKRADELEILVDDGSGIVEDARAKSGGARTLVAAAIRLGAGAMLRDLRGSRCAWAQVDEPFGALDARNRRELARTFGGMLGAVGLEQAFVVSHDAALLDGLPGRIEVTREGDRSRVEVIR